MSIVDESGTAIVNYSYDSWGRLLQIEGSKKDTIGVLIIKGEKSAVVFTPGHFGTEFFGCQNGKWKLPEYKLTRIVEKHQIDRNYYILTYHIGNEKGIYIIVTDQKPETSSGKKVVDSV